MIVVFDIKAMSSLSILWYFVYINFIFSFERLIVVFICVLVFFIFIFFFGFVVIDSVVMIVCRVVFLFLLFFVARRFVIGNSFNTSVDLCRMIFMRLLMMILVCFNSK